MNLRRFFALSVIFLARALPHEWRPVRGLLRPIVRAASKYPGSLIVAYRDIKFKVNLHDSLFQQSIAFFPRHIDTGVVAYLSNKVRDDDVFFDIGSHAGFYAILVASMKNRNTHTIALEADPHNVEKIYRNFSLNNLEHRNLVISGAAGPTGTIELHINEKNRGSNSTIMSTGVPGKTVIVPSDTILGWLAASGYEFADIMKLDIEGAELDCLTRYFCDQTEHRLPRILVVEINCGFANSTSLVNLIEGKGYILSFREGDNYVYER